jgi:hypothetical protein
VVPDYKLPIIPRQPAAPEHDKSIDASVGPSPVGTQAQELICFLYI